MYLNNVTLSGVDEFVDFSDLDHLSRMYPFVEWGILIKKSTYSIENRLLGGSAIESKKFKRYPKIEWIDSFVEQITMTNPHVRLSYHICGIEAIDDFIISPDGLLGLFTGRVQINIGHDLNSYMALLLNGLLNQTKRRNIIIQVSDVTNPAVSLLDARHTVLFDPSRGTGKPIDLSEIPVELVRKFAYVGFAGGINPHNIVDIAKEIESRYSIDKPDSKLYYLDMESGIRNNDNLFSKHCALGVLQSMKEHMLN